ncbi:DUF7344 domain-containing protein [Halalkalicoccus tibetensis]|uniref:DUF7344 domain-containing protein n=1 Tax=Halalkalicoccus tibetensis TaxID=175632 RepID=A0ABD5V699_9EURY
MAHGSTKQHSSLSLDTVFELLANKRRRFALYSLLDSSENPIEFETLVEDVATLEAAILRESLTRELYQNVAADLYQWHLPVLSDVGTVDCDPRHELIRCLDQPLLAQWAARVRHDELSQPEE